MRGMRVERLEHLGIVAGICREIGLTEYLDTLLALATTRQGDVPLFCQALDGNASDKLSLVAVVEALAEQLRAEDAEAPIFVADTRAVRADARRR